MLYIIIGSAVAAVILVVVLIILKKIRKKKEAMRRVAEDKLRESNLDQLILNPNAPKDSMQTFAEKPFEMKYSLDPANSAMKGLMLQIEEISEISRRQYMINPATPFTIGSGMGNTILLSDPNVDAKQCEMGISAGAVYICNIGRPDNVRIIRGKNSFFVGPQKVAVQKNELIQIGGIKLVIHFVKAS